MTLPPEIEADAKRQSWREAIKELSDPKTKIPRLLKDSEVSEAEKRGVLVEEVLSRCHFITLEDTRDVWHYKNGVFVENGETKILAELQQIAGYELDNKMRSEVLATIKSMTLVPRENLDNYPGWVHVGNGWINCTTKEFKKDSSDMLSTFKLPWDYDPKATNPEQQKFFADIFEEQDQPVVKKFLGYLLLPDQRFKKAFLGIGPKDTGKSRFAELVEKFVGMVSHVSLQDMASRNHNVVKITKSIVNTASEMPRYELKDVSLFKAITGGDEQQYREIYGKPFSAKPRAKILVVANDKPNFDGQDRTFIERWIVFKFTNVFKAGEDMDTNIMVRLTTPAEMSGLLNYALEGLTELLKDGYFKIQAWEDVKADWDGLDDKLAEYKANHCVLDKQYSILVEDLYSHYRANGGDLSKPVFGREIRKLGIRRTQVRVGSRREWQYEGITTKERVESGLVTSVTSNSENIFSYNEGCIQQEDHSILPVTPVTESQPEGEGGEEWLRCPICGELCLRKSGLDWHLKQHTVTDSNEEGSKS